MNSNSHPFNLFPKKRPDLPQAYQDIYAREYSDNREGRHFITNVAQNIEKWMHSQIVLGAEKLPSNKILEIGAGTLNHVQYEQKFKQYDFIEPMDFLFANKPERDKIHDDYKSIYDIPDDRLYDRIISTAVLEHVTDLPNVVAKSGLMLEKGGIFQAGIPSEGGFLWGLAWRCTTGLSYKMRHNLDYGVLMRHEHVNEASEIIEIVKYFYKNVKVKWFGLPWLHGSLYAYIEATEPLTKMAQNLLSKG